MFKLTSVFSLITLLGGLVAILAEPAAVARSSFLKRGARIINGNPAERTQFPYMAYIRRLRKGWSWSAGVLISSDYVLTSAHTMLNVKEGFVFLGMWNRAEPLEEFHQNKEVPANGILIHPEYDGDTVQNDIALVKLKYSVVFTAYVQAIALPKHSTTSLDLVGRKAYAAGWGRTSQHGAMADVLRYIEIDIIDNSHCKALDDDVSDANICISTMGRRSPCYGDSGGPLVIKSGTKDILVGIGSRGTDPDNNFENENPLLYTRVTSYLNWIKNNTNVSNFEEIV